MGLSCLEAFAHPACLSRAESRKQYQAGMHCFLLPKLPSSVRNLNKIHKLPNVEFYQVPATKENYNLMISASFKGICLQDYDKEVREKLGARDFRTASYIQVNSASHLYGFMISETSREEFAKVQKEPGVVEVPSPVEGIRVCKKEQPKPIAHHEDEHGVVTYHGFVWLFLPRLNFFHIPILRLIYSTATGFGNRGVSTVLGWWGYGGPRRTYQARPSMLYSTSVGHFLYNSSVYNDVVLPFVSRIINSLSREAEDCQVACGDTLTRVLLDAKSSHEGTEAKMQVSFA